MAQFSVNAQCFDPYKNFKFRVKWDGRYVAGISKVSALKCSIGAVDYREGDAAASSRQLPGRTNFGAITLERGVTYDTEFQKWATCGGGTESSLLRKDIIIEIYNEANQFVLAYKVYHCLVSEFQATADLDANANAVLIHTIKLENEGWERDYEVTESSELTFTEPA